MTLSSCPSRKSGGSHRAPVPPWVGGHRGSVSRPVGQLVPEPNGIVYQAKREKMTNGDFGEIVKECEGCQNIRVEAENGEKKTCKIFLYPESKWSGGKVCPMATHVKREVKEEVRTQDPLKLSKQKARKRA
ncbi:MAG TPA: PxxKW family cysteine-rich protein [Thermodesulfobacteriota bacterium]|nr:PxxKW family cysteine-rich protein [Thermodesulfobacteriota bacterium]